MQNPTRSRPRILSTWRTWNMSRKADSDDHHIITFSGQSDLLTGVVTQ